MTESRETRLPALGVIRFNWRGLLQTHELTPPPIGIHRVKGIDPDAAPRAAREATLNWMLGGETAALSPEHFDGKEFQYQGANTLIEAGSWPTRSEGWHDSFLWAARLTRRDSSNPDAVERVDVALDAPRCYHVDDQPPQIAVRVTASDGSYLWPPRLWPPIPLMRALATSPGLSESGVGPADTRVAVGTGPWALRDRADVDSLFAFLIRPDRLPLVVLTRPEARRPGAPESDYLIDPQSLAEQACGLAHVVAMPPDATRRWTELVGRELTVFWGAIAIYQPIAASIEDEDPRRHRRWLAEHVLQFEYGPKRGTPAFTDHLLDELGTAAARRWHRTVGYPLFFYDYIESCRFNARQREAVQRLREDASPGQGDAQSAVVSTDELEARLTAAEREVADWQQLAEEFEREARQAREDYILVANQLALGEQRMKDDGGRSISAESAMPATLSGLREWAEKWLPHKLVLHPRAIRSAEESPCEWPDVVYQCLLVLAKDYRDMKLSVEGAKARYEDRLASLGVQDEFTISDTGAGQEGEAYFVAWPLGGSKKRKLERHLKKGNDRSGRRLLRIYFFWDDGTQRVIVGYLPGHLPTRIS